MNMNISFIFENFRTKFCKRISEEVDSQVRLVLSLSALQNPYQNEDEFYWAKNLRVFS